MKEATTMTVSQALEAGYEKFGYNTDGWQIVNEIDQLCEDDFEHGTPVVFEERKYSPSIDAEIIRELLAEHVECNHSDETGDDTGNVYDTIMKLDFEATAKLINESIADKKYYFGTNIALTL